MDKEEDYPARKEYLFDFFRLGCEFPDPKVTGSPTNSWTKCIQRCEEAKPIGIYPEFFPVDTLKKWNCKRCCDYKYNKIKSAKKV